MSSKSRQQREPAKTLDITTGKRGLWGAFAGVIVALFILFPLNACISFARNPQTQKLFGGHLANTSQAGFAAFWWIMALLCLALPFLVGFGIARLSTKTLGVIVAIVAVFFILVVVLGQLFVF